MEIWGFLKLETPRNVRIGHVWEVLPFGETPMYIQFLLCLIYKED